LGVVFGPGSPVAIGISVRLVSHDLLLALLFELSGIVGARMVCAILPLGLVA
jgi:hypothetical protein